MHTGDTKAKNKHVATSRCLLPASPQPKVGLGTVPVGVPCLRNLKLQQFSFLIIQTLHIDYTYTEDVHMCPFCQTTEKLKEINS
jgi:hypothetical protein